MLIDTVSLAFNQGDRGRQICIFVHIVSSRTANTILSIKKERGKRKKEEREKGRKREWNETLFCVHGCFACMFILCTACMQCQWMPEEGSYTLVLGFQDWSYFKYEMSLMDSSIWIFGSQLVLLGQTVDPLEESHCRKWVIGGGPWGFTAYPHFPFTFCDSPISCHQYFPYATPRL